MKAFYAEEQKRYDPKAFLSSGAPQPNPEKPERIERFWPNSFLSVLAAGRCRCCKNPGSLKGAATRDFR